MSAVASTTTPRRNCNLEVVIITPPRSQVVSLNASTASQPSDNDDDDKDDDLSDEQIARLLEEAAERMSKGLSAPSIKNVTSIKLPKLDPGSSFPKPPITSNGSISRITDKATLAPVGERMLAEFTESVLSIGENKNKKTKNDEAPTAGPKWFDLPRTDSSAVVKRDMQIIKARNVLDSHRHYRKDTSALPKFSQMGTVIEGNTEFFSARIDRKYRKKTIVDELLADGTNRDKFKRKYDTLQRAKKSGKKEFYKKIKEQRNKRFKK